MNDQSSCKAAEKGEEHGRHKNRSGVVAHLYAAPLGEVVGAATAKGGPDGHTQQDFAGFAGLDLCAV